MHVPLLNNRSDIWTRPRLGLMKTSCSVTSRCCCVVMAGQEIPGATFGFKKKGYDIKAYQLYTGTLLFKMMFTVQGFCRSYSLRFLNCSTVTFLQKLQVYK
jgi:hypothetical protein